jgi:hypothetical protein
VNCLLLCVQVITTLNTGKLYYCGVSTWKLTSTTSSSAVHAATVIIMSRMLLRLQVITTLNTGKLYYCGVFHPEPDKQNVLMAGCADKKIYQFDFNTGDVEQVCVVTNSACNIVTHI